MSHKGFRPAILHPASLCALLLLTLSLIALVEYACRALPSTGHDVFQELRNRDLDPMLVTGPELLERSITVTFVETISISATSQIPVVPHHHDRDAKPQGTSAPNPDAFLKTTISSNIDGSHETFSISSGPTPSSYLPTTAQSWIASSANPSAYLDPNAQPTSSPGPGAPNPINYLQEKNGYVNGTGRYFVGAYLPTIIAVLFALPWLVLNQTVISLEPFYQLSSPTGAPAESTLTSSLVSLTSAFHSLKNGHWTVVLSTVLMLSAIAITPIAPETLAIQTIGQCDHKSTTGCAGVIRVLMPGARAIQAILAVMSISSMVLIVLVWRRQMRVSSDPRSIATLASICLDPAVQQDFREIGAAASQSTLKVVLNGNAYRLSFVTRYDGVNLISIVKTRGQQAYAAQNLYKHDYSSLDWSQVLRQAPRYRFAASVLFLLLAALEAVIIAYYYTGGDTAFENFMSGQGFGVRFLFTGIGIIISSYWKGVFQSVALIAPYSSLAEGNASARESILITPSAHPLFAIRTSISARHFVFFVVTIVAVLSEILTITLATIPFNSANFHMTYVTSTWISVGIIAMMLLVLILLFFYHEPMLPVKPDTIAGHLVYLADSSLPGMFAGMAADKTRIMQKRIEGLGLRYKLRQARDVAGMLAVDVEETTRSHDAIATHYTHSTNM